MRRIARLLVLVGVPLAAQQPVSPVGFTRSTHAVHAFSDSGVVTLQVSRQQLDVQYPGGRKERGDVIVVYDPQGEHYYWRYTRVDSRYPDVSFLHDLEAAKEAVFATPHGLYEFGASGGLYVKEYTEKAGSLGSAEQLSLAEIERGLPVFEGKGYARPGHEVPVGEAIGMDFACLPFDPPRSMPDASCGWVIKSIVSVSREAENWRVVLRNRWDQEVILDSQFRLVSTKRLEKPEK